MTVADSHNPIRVFCCALHCNGAVPMRRLRGGFPSASPLLVSLSFSSSSSSSSHSRCGRPAVRLPPDDPPRPKKAPFTASAHGQTWQDPYHWMSDTRDPDLMEHLRRENLYADAFMADTEGLRRRLVSEMRGRMPAKVSTPPERWGPWVYYQYIPEGREYPILCRRWERYDSFSKAFSAYLKSFKNEEILLDWNELAENFGYVHVGTCRVSPNHRFLAYTVDNSGGELFNLQVKDLQTGQIVNKSEVNGVVSLAWAITNDRLFYTMCDDTQRPCSVHCTKIGLNAEDVLLFTEKDTSCCLDIASTKDGKFITINSNTRASSEVRVIDSANEHNELWLVQERVTGVQYFLEHHHGFFYILTNSPSEYAIHDSGGYHLARCSANKKSQFANWQDIIIPDQDAIIQDMDIFDGHLVLFLQRRNLPALCSIELPIDVDLNVSMRPLQVDELKPWFFPLPSDLCSFIPATNHDFQTSNYRVVISSPVMPDLIVDYNMSKKDFTFVHQEEVRGLPKADRKATESHFNDGSMGFHCSKHQQSTDCIQSWDDFSNRFYCERIEVVSHDGTKVPLTILYSHKAWHPGRSPGLLHGYGAYGEALDKSWCANRISLLDRGWVLAFADVRGGEGIEPSWHEAGSGLHKLNSVLDFIACGKYLVKEGFVLKDKLCAIGCSAGGLLVGATMNMCPGLFSAAILKVPFLDMCNTMLDPTLPLTTLDYEEFGDPRIETEFGIIRSYSPYDNIPVGVCHPPMLIMASFNDSRVGVWEAAKWVARVRDNSCLTCSQMIILRTNMTGGHFLEGGRFKQCEDAAEEYAFLIKAVGMFDDEDQSEVL